MRGSRTVDIHHALVYSSFSLGVRKKRLVPIDLASTASYMSAGAVLNELATTPGRDSLMLQCEHTIGTNFAENIVIAKRRPEDGGGDVRVVDVLRAIHDFLYERGPNPTSSDERALVVAAYKRRKEKERDKDSTPPIQSPKDSTTDIPTKVEMHQGQDFVKMDLLHGKSYLTGLTPSSDHDYKFVFKLAAIKD